MRDYLRFIILLAAGWINWDQQKIIDYLVEEIRVYREHFEGCRLRFTDEQRRRLSAKAKALGRKTLEQFAGIVTPDTLLRWFRNLVARKYDGSAKLSSGARSRDGHGCEIGLLIWPSEWRTKIRRGDTPGSGMPCTISGSWWIETP